MRNRWINPSKIYGVIPNTRKAIFTNRNVISVYLCSTDFPTTHWGLLVANSCNSLLRILFLAQRDSFGERMPPISTLNWQELVDKYSSFLISQWNNSEFPSMTALQLIHLRTYSFFGFFSSHLNYFHSPNGVFWNHLLNKLLALEF